MFKGHNRAYRFLHRVSAMLMVALMLLSTFSTAIADGVTNDMSASALGADVQEVGLAEDILEEEVLESEVIEEPEIDSEPIEEPAQPPIEEAVSTPEPSEAAETDQQPEITPDATSPPPAQPEERALTLAELPEFVQGYARIAPQSGMLVYAYTDLEMCTLAGVFESGAVAYVLSNGVDKPALVVYMHEGVQCACFVLPGNIVPMSEAQCAEYAQANADTAYTLDATNSPALAGVQLAEAKFVAANLEECATATPAPCEPATALPEDVLDETAIDSDAIAELEQVVEADADAEELAEGEEETGTPFTFTYYFEKDSYASGEVFTFTASLDSRDANKNNSGYYVYMKLPNTKDDSAGEGDYKLPQLIEDKETTIENIKVTYLEVEDADARFSIIKDFNAAVGDRYLKLECPESGVGGSFFINFKYGNGITKPHTFTINDKEIKLVKFEKDDDGKPTSGEIIEKIEEADALEIETTKSSTNITATCEWLPVKKSSKLLDKDGNEGVVAEKEDDGYKFPDGSKIEYTITSGPNNQDTTGRIWTKSYTVVDTLKLPTGFKLDGDEIKFTYEEKANAIKLGDKTLLTLPAGISKVGDTEYVTYNADAKTLTITYQRVHPTLVKGQISSMTSDMAAVADVITLYLDALTFDADAYSNLGITKTAQEELSEEEEPETPPKEDKASFDFYNTVSLTPTTIYDDALGTTKDTAHNSIPLPVNLVLEKTSDSKDTGGTVNAGEEFNYIITVTNPEESDAAQAILKDNLPIYVSPAKDEKGNYKAITVEKKTGDDGFASVSKGEGGYSDSTVYSSNSLDVRFKINPGETWRITVPVKVDLNVFKDEKFTNTAELFYWSTIHNPDGEVAANPGDDNVDNVKIFKEESSVSHSTASAKIEKETKDRPTETDAPRIYYGATKETVAYLENFSCFNVTITVPAAALESAEGRLRVHDVLPLGVYATGEDGNKLSSSIEGMGGEALPAGVKFENATEKVGQTIDWALPAYDTEEANGWYESDNNYIITYSIPVRYDEGVLEDSAFAEDEEAQPDKEKHIFQVTNTAYLWRQDGEESFEEFNDKAQSGEAELLSASSLAYIADRYKDIRLSKKVSEQVDTNESAGKDFYRDYTVKLRNYGTEKDTKVFFDELPLGTLFGEGFTWGEGEDTITLTDVNGGQVEKLGLKVVSYPIDHDGSVDEDTSKEVKCTFTLKREVAKEKYYGGEEKKDAYKYTLTIIGPNGTEGGTFTAAAKTEYELSMKITFENALLRQIGISSGNENICELNNIAHYGEKTDIEHKQANAVFVTQHLTAGGTGTTYDKIGYRDADGKDAINTDEYVMFNDIVYFRLFTFTADPAGALAERIDVLPEGLKLLGAAIYEVDKDGKNNLVAGDYTTTGLTYPKSEVKEVLADKAKITTEAGTQDGKDTLTVSYGTLEANKTYIVGLKVWISKPMVPAVRDEDHPNEWYIYNKWYSTNEEGNKVAETDYPLKVARPEVRIDKTVDKRIVKTGEDVTFSIPSILQTKRTGVQPLANVWLVDDISDFLKTDDGVSYALKGVTKGEYEGKVLGKVARTVQLQAAGEDSITDAVEVYLYTATKNEDGTLTWDSGSKLTPGETVTLPEGTTLDDKSNAVLVWKFGSVTADFAVKVAPTVTFTCTVDGEKKTITDNGKRTNHAYLLFNNETNAPVIADEAALGKYTKSNIDSETIQTTDATDRMTLTKSHKLYAGNPSQFNEWLTRAGINDETYIQYTIAAQNTGTVATQNVTITDTLPEELIWDEGSVIVIQKTTPGGKTTTVRVVNSNLDNNGSYTAQVDSEDFLTLKMGKTDDEKQTTITIEFKDDFEPTTPSTKAQTEGAPAATTAPVGDRVQITYRARINNPKDLAADEKFQKKLKEEQENDGRWLVENKAELKYKVDSAGKPSLEASTEFEIVASPMLKLSKVVYDVYRKTDVAETDAASDTGTYEYLTQGPDATIARGDVLQYKIIAYAGDTGIDLNMSQLTDQIPAGMTFKGVALNKDATAFESSTLTEKIRIESRLEEGTSTDDFFTSYRDGNKDVSYSATAGENNIVTLKVGEANSGYTLPADTAIVFDVFAEVTYAGTDTDDMTFTNKATVSFPRDSQYHYMNMPLLLGSAYTFATVGNLDLTTPPNETTHVNNGANEDFSATATSTMANIVPDIKKNLYGYNIEGNTYTGTNITEYKAGDTQLRPGSNLRWEIVITNAGTATMTNYNVVDILPPEYSISDEPKKAGYECLQHMEILKTKGTESKISDNQYPPFAVEEKTVDGKQQSTVRWSFTGATFALEKGESLILRFTTNYQMSNAPFGMYTNVAQVFPTQPFSATNRPDDTEATVINNAHGEMGLETSLYIMAYGEFSSNSWKRITATGVEQEDTATCRDATNYVEGVPGGIANYKLYVQNTCGNDFRNIVLIDRMPGVGDKGIGYLVDRDSQFAVNLVEVKDGEVVTETPDPANSFELKITDVNTKKTTALNPDTDYTIEFANWNGGFTKDDWDGEAAQKNQAQWNKTFKTGDNVFRIVLRKGLQLTGRKPSESKSESDAQSGMLVSHTPFTADSMEEIIAANAGISTDVTDGSTLEVSYYGQVDASAVNSQFAWNNFGYRYYYGENNNSFLTPEPPKVGIYINQPKLVIKKEVLKGASDTSSDATEFEFKLEVSDNGTDWVAYDGKITRYGTDNKPIPETTTNALVEAEASGIFKLQAGQYVVIEEMKVGQRYRISEKSGTDSDGNPTWALLENGKEYRVEYDSSAYLAQGSNTIGVLSANPKPATITNKRGVSLTVKKTWVDSGETIRPKQIKLGVYSQDTDEATPDILLTTLKGYSAEQTVDIDKLKEGFTFTDLPIIGEGLKYVVKETMDENYGYYYITEVGDVVNDKSSITTADGDSTTGKVNPGDTLNCAITNYQKGQLKVTKKRVGGLDTEFEFKVYTSNAKTQPSGDEGWTAYKYTPQGGEETDTFKLKNGNHFTISDLKYNTWYKIVETKNDSYYTGADIGGYKPAGATAASSEASYDKGGNYVVIGQITSSEPKQEIIEIAETVTNTYLVPLKISKKVVGEFTGSNGEFAFKVEYKYPEAKDYTPYSGSYTVANDAATAATLENSQSTENGIIKLKAGQTATLAGYPVGTMFKVTEGMVDADGTFTPIDIAAIGDFFIQADRNNGNKHYKNDFEMALSSGTGDANLITFTNTQAVPFTLKKTVSETEEGKTFTFKVYVDGKDYGDNGYKAYTLSDDDSSKTYDAEGLDLQADQTATFKAPLGSEIKIEEISDYNEGYFYPEMSATGEYWTPSEDSPSTSGVPTIKGKLEKPNAQLAEATETAVTINFNNIKHADKVLTLEKVNGGDVDDNSNKEFTFTVNRKQHSGETVIYDGPYIGNVTIYTSSSDTTGSSKRINGTITLKYGQYAKIPVMVGDNITITETGNLDDYNVTVSPATSAVPATEETPANKWTGTIAEEDITVTYTNTRKADLKVTKTTSVNGQGTGDDTGFTFTLKKGAKQEELAAANGETYTVDGETKTTGTDGTFTLKIGQTATFSNLGYGTYYAVTETGNNAYATTPPKNASGQLIGSETTDTVVVNTTFKNDLLVNLQVAKVVDSKEEANADLLDMEFTFDVKIGSDNGGDDLEPYSGQYKIVTARGGADAIGGREVNKTFTALEGKIIIYPGEVMQLETPYPIGTEYSVKEVVTDLSKFGSITGEADNAQIEYGKEDKRAVNLVTIENSLDYHLLEIKKEVVNGQNSDEFSFMLYIGGSATAYSGTYFLNGDLKETQTADEGIITLTAGQSAVIRVDNKSTYKVVELRHNGYFEPAIAADPADGVTLYNPDGYSATGTLDKDTTLTYTNTRHGELKVTLEKKLIADNSHSNDEFSFTVTRTYTPVGGTEQTIPYEGNYIKYTSGADGEETATEAPLVAVEGVSTITLKNGERAEFYAQDGDVFTFEELGTYNEDGKTTDFITEVTGATADANNKLKATATVATSSAPTVTYTNTLRTSLKLSKVIDLRETDPAAQPASGDSQIDTTKEFTFTVTIDGELYSGAYTLNNDTTPKTTTDGVIKLKHDDSAVINDLKYGTSYTIEEAYDPDYTDPAITTVGDGEPERVYEYTGTLTNNTTGGDEGVTIGNDVTFTNVPRTVLPIIKVSKHVTGKSNPSDYFTFTLTQIPEEGSGVLYRGAINIGDTDSEGNVSNLRRVEVTDGTFRLKHNEIALIPIDDTLYTVFKVRETEERNYKTSITLNKENVTEEEDGYTAMGDVRQDVHVEYTNGYRKPIITINDLYISKTVTGEGAPGNDVFQFNVTINGAPYVGAYSVGTDTYTAVMGRVELKAGQTAIISGLAQNTSYTVAEIDDDDDDYTLTSSDGASGMLSSTSGHASFTNAYEPKSFGKLTLTKAVTGEGALLDKKFAFTIQVSGTNYEGAYTLNGMSMTMTAGYVELANGDTIAIEKLPVGASYSIAEADYSTDGYTGEGTKTGTIQGDGVATSVTYTNTYGAPKGTLVLTKTVTGEGAEIDRAFEFTVNIGGTPYTGAYDIGNTHYAAMAGGKVSLKHGDTLTISELKLEQQYGITEADYSADGYTAVLTDNATGTISAATPNVEVSALNTFTQPQTAQLSITKLVTGDGADLTRAFAFTVTIDDKLYSGPYTLNDGSTHDMANGALALSHGQTATIANLKLDQAYTVTEEDYSAEGYTTKDAPASGSLSANTALTIMNTYEPEINTDGQLTISKVQVGGPADAEFVFTVRIDNVPYQGDYTRTSANGETSVISTAGGMVTLKGGETAHIEKLPVAKAYSVSETNSTGFVTTPSNVQTGTIAEDTSVGFTNTYEAPKGSLRIAKQVVNSTTNQQFTFTLLLNGDPYAGAYSVINANSASESRTAEAGILKLRGGETAVIEGIEVGTTYEITESEAVGFTANKLTGSGTITTGTATETFVNTYLRRDGDIVIAKTQLGGARGIKFDFTVQVGTRMYVGPYMVYAADGTSTAYANMEAGNLRLASGETAVIKGIPEGTYYRVREAASAGFTTNSADQSGNTTENGAYITFVNTYAANSLVIEKRHEGGDQAQRFEFTVTIGGALYANSAYQLISADGAISAQRTAANGTLTLSGGEKAQISGLNVGTPYTVTETPGNAYTTQSYNEQGNLASGVTNVLFVNTDTLARDAELYIRKLQEGGTGGQTFSFHVAIAGLAYVGEYSVRRADGSLDMLTTADGSMQLRANETAHIAGAFDGKSYSVTELNTGAEFVGSATGANGTLTYTAPAEAVFTNRAATELEITKTQLGGEPGEVFMFFVTIDGALYEGDYTYYMEDGTASYEIAYDGLIMLFDGERAVISGLPYGAEYEVIEAYGPDYQTEATGETGILDGHSVAAFINTYSQVEAPIGMAITKTVINGLDTQGFSFTAYFDGKPYSGVYTHIDADGKSSEYSTINGTFKLRNGERVEIDGLRPGTAYEIVEAQNDMYTTESINASGVLTEDGIEAAEVTFTNTFKNVGPLPPTGDDLPLNALLALGMALILTSVLLALATRRMKKHGAM